MPKRAERRHHEERIKDKFRRVVRDIWTASHFWQDDRKRREFIEEAAVRKAHHAKCDCWMCHGERYDRKRDQPEIENDE